MEVCAEINCNDRIYARSLCRRHYMQLLYHSKKNDPLYKEKKSEANRRDYLKRREVILSYQRKRREANPDKVREIVRISTRKLRARLNKNKVAKYYRFSRKDDVEFKKNRRLWQRSHRQKLRMIIINHYSNNDPKCILCGFTDLRALAVDHILNNGAAHKRSLNNTRGNTTMFRDIIKNNFPAEYQVLCWNCNYIKEYERRLTTQKSA